MKTKYKPFIMYAGYRQFKPKEEKRIRVLQSRMLLWCLSGNGVVVINGQSFNIKFGDCIITPWEFNFHLIVADELCSFATIHFIPNMRKGTFKDFKVGTLGNLLPHHDYREDYSIPNFDNSFITFSIGHNSSLSHLIHHIISWFSRKEKDVSISDHLAFILIQEIIYHKNILKSKTQYSQELKQILLEIDWKYKDLTIDYLMDIANCAKSTLYKFFKVHLKTTPFLWIRRKKLEYAKDLLLSTNCRIHEISTLANFKTPYYFSKVFKKEFNVSPKEYRRKNTMT